jgi:DNA-binding SARP family transcriptional activator
MGDWVEYGVLGPLSVIRSAHTVDISAPMLRRLLAVFLVRADTPLTLEAAAEALWDSNPPRAAHRTLLVYIHRLRRLLGEESIDYRASVGYTLRFAEYHLDLRVFSARIERATAACAAEDFAGAATLVRDAVRLWRGPAYADVRDIAVVADEAQRLDQQRPDAVELCAELDIRLGRHAQVLPELTAAVDEYPYRERLQGYLMIALYRGGRQADALEAYRRARIRLRDELGIDPTPDLQRLHQLILTSDLSLDPQPPRESTTVSVIPAQMPPDIADFTGRAADLSALENAPGLVVVSGTAGVGKSALVMHWAHRARGLFPDGQLFANLRGVSANAPLRPIEALGRFLRSLGVPAERIPVDVEEAAALYRSVLADRRMLVVLDNAADADQVRPLLPAAGGCRAVVISRNRLVGLIAGESAHSLHLDVLTEQDAEALLRRALGRGRVESEPLARDELLRLTARLPLALRLAVAHLAAAPETAISGYTAELGGGDVLSSFEVPGDERMAIRTAMRFSYARLTPRSRRAFRLLGVNPAPSVTKDVAVVAFDGSAPALGELTQASLLEQRGDDRYSFHDLLRRYAEERAAAEEPAGEIEAARRRLFEHYLDKLNAAADQLYPHVLRLPVTAGAAAKFDNPGAAMSWLDSERENLVVIIQYAADNEPYEMAWRMTDALRGYLSTRLLLVDWLVAAEAAVRAAQLAGDVMGLAAAEVSLQHLYHRRSEFTASRQHGEKALALARMAGWREGQIVALGNLGNTHRLSGDAEHAAVVYEEVLVLAQEAGLKAVAAASLGNLAAIDAQCGRLAATVERLHQSIALAQELGSAALIANINSNLGETYHLLGEADKARVHLRKALSANPGRDRGVEAEAMRVLALVEADTGDLDKALSAATESLRIWRETGQRPYEADALAVLSDVLNRRGEVTRAIETAEEAVALSTQLLNGRTQANAFIAMAKALGSHGDLDRALAKVSRACEITAKGGLRLVEGICRQTRAEINARRGESDAAQQDATAALAIFHETGHAPGEKRAIALLNRCRAQTS